MNDKKPYEILKTVKKAVKQLIVLTAGTGIGSQMVGVESFLNANNSIIISSMVVLFAIADVVKYKFGLDLFSWLKYLKLDK